jgi:GNAT superfamily N-acetyltransferase
MTAPTPALRPATAADVAELVRLRKVMMDAMGVPEEPTWERACAEFLAASLAEGTTGAVVADDPDRAARLVAGGVGTVAVRLPSPMTPNGCYGYIASMVTEEPWRGRGLATGIVLGLLDWFAGVGVHRVDLHASAQGEPVYRALGFTESTYPELRWRRAPLSGGIGLAP